MDVLIDLSIMWDTSVKFDTHPHHGNRLVFGDLVVILKQEQLENLKRALSVTSTVNIFVKNETEYAIEFVAGANEEHTIKPDEEVEIEVKDGDVMYLDQTVKVEE